MLDELKKKAEGVLNEEKVKDAVDKVKEFANSEKGKETIEHIKQKAQDLAEQGRQKAEDFVEEKTNGKGIFGFGKK